MTFVCVRPSHHTYLAVGQRRGEARKALVEPHHPRVSVNELPASADVRLGQSPGCRPIRRRGLEGLEERKQSGLAGHVLPCQAGRVRGRELSDGGHDVRLGLRN